ncbi:hypothetical protein [Oryzibacter oryziterrae]|uniref:hypothetical protein n=1 Tax=Oryzibacter oryziterrae TaxID=2766474 RepID=UPI001F285C9A|nr:hypothetical protein [Oryzibacter oryziterrae]
MESTVMRRPLAMATALLVLGCGWSRAEDAVADPALFNPLAAIGEDRLKAFAERPLFTPSRRAPEAEVDTPPTDPEPAPPTEPDTPDSPNPPNAKLLGILGTDADAIAVIQDQDAGQTLTLRVGDSIGDWQVAEIGDTSVTLSFEDQTSDLQLFQPGGAPAGAATDGAAASPDSGAYGGGDPSADTPDAAAPAEPMDAGQDNGGDGQAAEPEGQDPRTMLDRVRAMREAQQKASGNLFGHKPQKPGHHPPGFDPAQ